MRVHLSLGSNLGDPAANLRQALKALKRIRGVSLTAISQVYETEPIGGVHQPAFWNMAAEIETDLTPLELLDSLKEIEGRMGRTRGVRSGPRVIDLDIILWGDTMLKSERLTLPHTDFRRRAFVLAPLAEIAPDAVDPVTGRTIAEMAASPEAEGWVRPQGMLSDC